MRTLKEVDEIHRKLSRIKAKKKLEAKEEILPVIEHLLDCMYGNSALNQLTAYTHMEKPLAKIIVQLMNSVEKVCPDARLKKMNFKGLRQEFNRERAEADAELTILLNRFKEVLGKV